MIEIVFGESACGSLKIAQTYGKGKYRGSAVSIFMRHEDGSVPSSDEMKKAQLQAQEQERIAWENAIPLGGKSSDVYGFNQYKRRNKGERGETFRRTAQKFSAQYNVSTGSVQKYAIFSKALDVVGQADPELPGKVLSGTFKISHENLVALSKMPPEEIRRIGTRPEDLQHPFTSYSDTRKEFADTDEEPVESMQETLPLIKIPPM